MKDKKIFSFSAKEFACSENVFSKLVSLLCGDTTFLGICLEGSTAERMEPERRIFGILRSVVDNLDKVSFPANLAKVTTLRRAGHKSINP